MRSKPAAYSKIGTFKETDTDAPMPQCSYETRGKFLLQQCKDTHTDSQPDILALLLNHMKRSNSTKLPKDIKRLLPNNLVIDPNHNLTMCITLKAGSTSYRALLAQYSDVFMKQYPENQSAYDVFHNDVRKSKRFGIIPTQEATPSQLYDALTHYYKIVSVRHPFTRLYLFYNGKIIESECEKHGPNGYQPQIIDYNRGIRVANENDAWDMNITFAEFFAYYRDRREHDGNEHLKRITDACHPCMIKYDTFIRIETLNQDQEYIIDTIFSNSDKQIVGSNSQSQQRDAETSQSQLLKAANSQPQPVRHFSANSRISGVRNNFNQTLDQYKALSESDIDWMQIFYRRDMDLFGYTVERGANGFLNAICRIEIDNDVCC